MSSGVVLVLVAVFGTQTALLASVPCWGGRQGHHLRAEAPPAPRAAKVNSVTFLRFVEAHDLRAEAPPPPHEARARLVSRLALQGYLAHKKQTASQGYLTHKKQNEAHDLRAEAGAAPRGAVW